MADNEISGTENANGVSQLKPCPFCGGEAKPINDKHRWWVACRKCTAELGFEGQDQWGCYGKYDTKQDAIDAWNTRAERTCRMETEESCQNWNSCSECGADYYTDQPINYCPNCGAKVVSE